MSVEINYELCNLIQSICPTLGSNCIHFNPIEEILFWCFGKVLSTYSIDAFTLVTLVEPFCLINVKLSQSTI